MLPLCQVEFRGDRAELCVGGRVEAVCCSSTSCQGGCGFAMTLLFGEARDFAVLDFALDDDEGVDAFDHVRVGRCEAEHLVEYDSAGWQGLGCDKQSLAEGALGVGGEEVGEFGLDALRSDNYVTGGEREDSFVGEDGEAGIAG